MNTKTTYEIYDQICEIKQLVAKEIEYRLAFDEKMRETLQKARVALWDTMVRATNGYDWNADPDSITLKQGEALTAIDAAVAASAPRDHTSQKEPV